VVFGEFEDVEKKVFLGDVELISLVDESFDSSNESLVVSRGTFDDGGGRS